MMVSLRENPVMFYLYKMRFTKPARKSLLVFSLFLVDTNKYFTDNEVLSYAIEVSSWIQVAECLGGNSCFLVDAPSARDDSCHYRFTLATI